MEEDTEKSDSSDESDDSSDDDLNQAIAASVAETHAQARLSSSPEPGIKVERREDVLKKSVSYERVQFTKSSTATKQTKRPYSDCCYDEDDDQDDEEPLLIKKEPGTEEYSHITPKKRKAGEVAEAELQRQIRESEAEALLAPAQL